MKEKLSLQNQPSKVETTINEEREYSLVKYLKKISVQKKSITELSEEDTLVYLQEIYFSHITTIPFQNFELREISQQHHLKRKNLSLFDSNNLLSTQQGGYCYQSARLLYDALKTLGFTVDCCVARILNGQAVNDSNVMELPATHAFLLVSIQGKQYIVDPGLGRAAPKKPILFIENAEASDIICQEPYQFKFYRTEEGPFVLQKLKNNEFINILQTDMQPVTDEKLAYTLLQLENFPKTLPIRDQIVSVGIATATGSKSLHWDKQSKQFIFTEENHLISQTEEITCFKKATIKLMTEFNITHISADALKKYCSNTKKLLPENRWEINFPMDEKEKQSMRNNFI